MSDSPSQLLLDTVPRSPTAPHRWPPEAEDRRSRASEFYGFVAWTSTYLLFILYILWAVLPDEWIQWTGVTWYPNRYVRTSIALLTASLRFTLQK
jgi:phosphatidylinositol glycan class P protein